MVSQGSVGTEPPLSFLLLSGHLESGLPARGGAAFPNLHLSCSIHVPEEHMPGTCGPSKTVCILQVRPVAGRVLPNGSELWTMRARAR